MANLNKSLDKVILQKENELSLLRENLKTKEKSLSDLKTFAKVIPESLDHLGITINISDDIISKRKYNERISKNSASYAREQIAKFMTGKAFVTIKNVFDFILSTQLVPLDYTEKKCYILMENGKRDGWWQRIGSGQYSLLKNKATLAIPTKVEVGRKIRQAVLSFIKDKEFITPLETVPHLNQLQLKNELFTRKSTDSLLKRMALVDKTLKKKGPKYFEVKK